MFERLTDLAQQALVFIVANWMPFAVAAGILMLIVAVRAAHEPQRDPERLFDSSQKREGNRRAGNRCEQTVWMFFRCRRPAQHGDHWVPWSKGGATSIGNYAALCAPCNLRKSNHMPSWFATQRLQRRRRRYFPDGEDFRAGERYGH